MSRKLDKKTISSLYVLFFVSKSQDIHKDFLTISSFPMTKCFNTTDAY